METSESKEDRGFYEGNIIQKYNKFPIDNQNTSQGLIYNEIDG